MPATRRRRAKIADPVDVEKFVQDLPAMYIACRDVRHKWPDRPNDVGWIDKRSQTYWRIHRCERCTAEREQELEAGMVYRSLIRYPENYLMKGLGRINGDGLAVVRMTGDLSALDAKDEAASRARAKKKKSNGKRASKRVA